MIRALGLLLCVFGFGFSMLASAQVNSDLTIEESYEAEFIPQNSEDVERAYRAVKRDESYQYVLAEPIPVRQPSAFERAVGEFFGAIFSFLAPLLELAFWLGVGGLILGAVYLIGRAIYETRFALPAKKAEDTEPEIPLYQPAQAQARILLDEIDKLAAEGRYGEAVHTLLFRSIQDIDRNRPNVVRRSLTAREIGQLSVLTPEARTAFAKIAGVSELAHFGGVAVNQAGFDTARAAYAELTGLTGTAPRKRRK